MERKLCLVLSMIFYFQRWHFPLTRTAFLNSQQKQANTSYFEIVRNMSYFKYTKINGYHCIYQTQRYLFRVQTPMTTHCSACLTFFWKVRQCKQLLLIHHWICAPGTHCSWVHWGNVEYSFYLTCG